MQTITVLEAKTHLSRYLAAVEMGEEVTILRGRKPIARLVPFHKADANMRPKVGQTLGKPFEIPMRALASMSKKELHAWGL
jgi:antitoxin (DNA-binding transcriptional repressor) of toxin-antitoxin stability system